MNASVPWLRPRTDVLLANETSCVEEYLWALQNQPPVVSSSADATKADCASLWPEALYPDMYGKLLDQEQMAQSVRLHSARGCAFPTISTPPGAAASLKIHDAAEDKLMQQAEATGRKKPRQQRKGRISHRRAEAKIAALSRARRAAAATGRSRTAARRTCLKARELAKLEA
ncbi:hypothetical protein N0V95_010048 [Ascochyta clinopodiicola]|nr:hypothetical protein N0V95_010048 [Ascochyta clinopodiicola]